jgi:hypothetical protein
MTRNKKVALDTSAPSIATVAATIRTSDLRRITKSQIDCHVKMIQNEIRIAMDRGIVFDLDDVLDDGHHRR